jgi:chorismate-pyruvate lyase
MKINWKNKIYKGKNQDFLNYKSSITNKISQKASLKIERNKDFPNTIFNDEKLFFKTSRSGSLFLREVLIYANDQPIIYARTVFKKNLRQLSGLVKKLNENPLANIVFKKKTKRSEFIFSHMSPNYKLSKRLNEKQIAIKKFVGARQSNFLCKG